MTRPIWGVVLSRRACLWVPIALTVILAPLLAKSQVLPSPAPLPEVFESGVPAAPASSWPEQQLEAEAEVEVDQARDASMSHPEAVARFAGVAAPGLEVSLSGLDSRGQGLQYRWVQTGGTPVTLDDAASPQPRFLVPRGVDQLDFLLVVSNAKGVDTATLSVPVSNPLPGPRPSRLIADAGDDQIGLVGNEVTLNGLRSEPRGQIGYRWIQVGGPTVRLKIEDGYIYTFIPPAPGIYRFALVVAAGNEISAPSFVSVTVASSLPGSGDPYQKGWETQTAAALLPPAEMIRSGFATIEGSASMAVPLAEAFDAIAMRVDLYESFSDLSSELTRRLDQILPTEPSVRSYWNRRIFEPMSDRLIRELLQDGLDLRQSNSHTASLTATQRARLADLFRAMAEGFRGPNSGR